MADINNSLGQIASTTTDQNNIDVLLSIQSVDGSISDIVSKINSNTTFAVNDKQSLWVRATYYVPGETIIDDVVVAYLNVFTKVFKVLNKGKGTYGTGGTITIVQSDLLLVETTEPTVADIILNPETDIFYITTLGSKSIE